eukprot:scaffold304_cov248-Pinguiococcus_pyrenoidosus.AAC.20
MSRESARWRSPSALLRALAASCAGKPMAIRCCIVELPPAILRRTRSSPSTAQVHASHRQCAARTTPEPQRQQALRRRSGACRVLQRHNLHQFPQEKVRTNRLSELDPQARYGRQEIGDAPPGAAELRRQVRSTPAKRFGGLRTRRTFRAFPVRASSEATTPAGASGSLRYSCVLCG